MVGGGNCPRKRGLEDWGQAAGGRRLLAVPEETGPRVPQPGIAPCEMEFPAFSSGRVRMCDPPTAGTTDSVFVAAGRDSDCPEEESVSPRASEEWIPWMLLRAGAERRSRAAWSRAPLGRLFGTSRAQCWAFGRRALAGALAATSACLCSIPLQSVGLLPRVCWDHRPTGCGRARRSPHAASRSKQ